MLSFNIPVARIRTWVSLAIQESNYTSNLRGIIKVILFPLRCLREGPSLSEVDPRDEFCRVLTFGCLQVPKFPGSK